MTCEAAAFSTVRAQSPHGPEWRLPDDWIESHIAVCLPGSAMNKDVCCQMPREERERIGPGVARANQRRPSRFQE
jgi:hypothetical protein